MNTNPRPPTHWCQVGESFLFLDPLRSRYFMLERSAADRFARIILGSREEGDPDWLTERALDNLAPPIDRSRPEVITPTRSLLGEPDLGRASAADTARAIWSLAKARQHVRNLPLSNVLSFPERADPAPQQVQWSDARDAAAAFQRARHYVSGLDECLSRGVAMRRLLAAKGCEARLVIGVTLPFAAHCWVQRGSTVLTDPLDVVTPYTPIVAA